LLLDCCRTAQCQAQTALLPHDLIHARKSSSSISGATYVSLIISSSCGRGTCTVQSWPENFMPPLTDPTMMFCDHVLKLVCFVLTVVQYYSISSAWTCRGHPSSAIFQSPFRLYFFLSFLLFFLFTYAVSLHSVLGGKHVFWALENNYVRTHWSHRRTPTSRMLTDGARARVKRICYRRQETRSHFHW